MTTQGEGIANRKAIRISLEAIAQGFSGRDRTTLYGIGSSERGSHDETTVGTMGAMKAFAVGVARIATIIVVVIVALAGLGFGGVAVWENWKEARDVARNAPLEELKVWPPLTIEALGGVKLTLSTKWREGDMLYQFDVNGYPPEIAAAKDMAQRRPSDNELKTAAAKVGASIDPNDPRIVFFSGNEEAFRKEIQSITESRWILSFLDKDGFQAFNVAVPLGEMERVVANAVVGQYKGLSANTRARMSADEYRRAANWEPTWSGFPDPKRPALVGRRAEGAVAVGERVRLPSERQPDTSNVRWVDEMDGFLGRLATVIGVDGDGFIKVDIDRGKSWWASEWVTRSPVGR